MNFFEIILWSLIIFITSFYFVYYGVMIYNTRKPNKIKKRKILPKVTLIIPTYNEEKVILRKLENIKDLDYPKERFEVLIIDSGSSDSTHQKVKNFLIHNQRFGININLITQKERLGKAIALNSVWSHCHNEVVIISDADAIFRKDSILQIVQNFADPSVGAVTGKLVILDSEQCSMTKLEEGYRSIFDVIRIGESQIDSTPIFNGPIMAFRRELLDELNPDTIADDTELSLKVREKGWKTIYDPEALAYEHTPKGIKSTIRQKARRGQGVIQSLIWHRNFMFNPKYGKYGFIIFPCEFFMNIISPIIIISILILTILVTLITPIVIIYLALLTISVLFTSSLILLIQRKPKFNLIRILLTFLNHQFFLILGLSYFLLGKSSHKWEKIEEVRISK